MIGTILRVRYEITQAVAEGPIFHTFAARDRVEGREVAVRVLNPALAHEPDVARLLSAVVTKYGSSRSPGLESLIEVDEDQGSTFLVSELTRGITLTDRIRKLAPFSVPVSISTLISICEALAVLHSNRLPHGDLRPDNAIVLVDGQVRLQLPGVWECYSASPHAGALILPEMAPYLAPEISAGGMPNPTSDVYAAGVILFELISGRRPFHAETPVAMAIRHATAATPSVRMYNPSVPMVLDEIVKKAMAKDPAARYRNAAELLQDLRMMQDALRFGRSLTWPIQAETVSVAAAQDSIAPRMSAVRPEPKAREKKERVARERGDIPGWMYMLMAFFGVIVFLLFATWTWNFGHKAREIKVPKIVGMKVVEANKLLEANGLKMKLIGPPVPGDGPPDTIVQQIQGPGEKVREGTVITVKKSAGPATISVPRIIGMQQDAAKGFLERSDLKLDELVAKSNRGGAQEGEILEQDPQPYTSVPKGTKIRVVVQTNDAPTSTATPQPGDENIQAKYRLKIKLKGLSESVQVRITILDAQGVRDVRVQKGNPDELIDVTAIGYGREVTFQVYYNGVKVFEQKQQAPSAAIGSPSPTPTPNDDGTTTDPTPPPTNPDNG